MMCFVQKITYPQTGEGAAREERNLPSGTHAHEWPRNGIEFMAASGNGLVGEKEIRRLQPGVDYKQTQVPPVPELMLNRAWPSLDDGQAYRRRRSWRQSCRRNFQHRGNAILRICAGTEAKEDYRKPPSPARHTTPLGQSQAIRVQRADIGYRGQQLVCPAQKKQFCLVPSATLALDTGHLY